ncbi:MAG: outer membrane beta-barrel protein [Hyphomicrobiales bacterium]
MIKKLCLAAVAAPLFLATPAMAADYDIQETIVAPSWTGFYIGAGAGVSWIDYDASGKYCDDVGVCAVPNFIDDLVSNLDNDSAFRGIAQAGFDWEIVPGFLIGAQGDYNFGQELGYHETSDYVVGDVALYDRASYKVEDMWTVAGRLGWATEQTLFYGLAGWTWANTSMDLKGACWDSGCIADFKNDDTIDGWTLGTGVEFRDWWIDGLYTRIEYRYTDLGNKAVSGYDEYGEFYKLSTNQNVQSIFMTFGYRFDGL